MPFSNDDIDQLLIGEIVSQATYCLAAAAAANAAVAQRSVDETYRALHSVLTHAGNVSKLLWPEHVRKGDRATRMALRAKRVLNALQLPEPTERVLRDRSLRNHLEHFDERLDEWASHAPDGLIDRNIGPREKLGRFPDEAWLRNYDPARNEFTFWSETFDIAAIVAAISEARTRAIAAQVGRTGGA